MTENETIALLAGSYIVDYEGNTDQKRMDCEKFIVAALKELQEYRKLGTLEEVLEAVDKTKAKKCVENSYSDHTHYKCPTCGKIQKTKYVSSSFGCILNNCSNCGQKLKGEK